MTSDVARSTARVTDGALAVAMIDDVPLAHGGVRHLVSVQTGFYVVGEAETGIEAPERVDPTGNGSLAEITLPMAAT